MQNTIFWFTTLNVTQSLCKSHFPINDIARGKPNNSPIRLSLPRIHLVGGLKPSEKYDFVTWDDEQPNINGKMPKMATKPPTSHDSSLQMDIASVTFVLYFVVNSNNRTAN